MKKLLLLFVLLIGIITSTCAKNRGKIIPVNYYFVYTQATFDGKKASAYFQKRYKDNGAAFKKRIASTFVRAANRESLNHKGYSLSNSSTARYEVAIYFLAIDDDGEHRLVGKVYHKKSRKLVGTVNARSKGGRRDTMETLFIESLQRSGEKFGDKLADDVLDELYRR